VHGAIVNWAGHKYGYQKLRQRRQKPNTLPFDFLTMASCSRTTTTSGARADFAARGSRSIGLAVLRLLAAARIVTLRAAARVFPRPIARLRDKTL